MVIPDWMLPVIVFTPFAAAAVALFGGKWLGTRAGWLMVVAALACFSMTLTTMVGSGVVGGHHDVEVKDSGSEARATEVAAPAGGADGARGVEADDAHAPVTFVQEWIPDFDIALRFRADSFGLFFAMVISGIGLLVGFYSTHYIPNDLAKNRVGRYYASLIAFMGAMLGIALSDDLILLFVFWEITSITSFMLIGFWYEQDHARKGAWTALQVTGLGGLAMMAGFIMIGITADTFTISEIVSSPDLLSTIAASPLFGPALLLIFGGAFTKSAQWPFHFWLPNAMVAPTPVSTYLHAATMVKAGVFLVGRMWPIFESSPYWSPLLVTCGLITFSYTAYQAFKETDLKAILARTTLSTLGLVMMIYGLKAYDQDALQILNHAAYKGTLFLVVGIVEHATHTRDLNKLGGLRKQLPVTFWCCVLAALSMAGLPPFFGFVAKESLYASLLDNAFLAEHAALKWPIIGLAVVSNAFIFAVSWKLILGVFCGPRKDAHSPDVSHDAHEHGQHEDGGHGEDDHGHHGESFGLWLPPLVLASVTLIVGLLGATKVVEFLVNGFSSKADAHAHVTLIPSLSHPEPLYLSLATIGLGVLFYFGRRPINAAQRGVDNVLPTMQSLWDVAMHSVTAFATGYSKWWQRGSLRWYITGILMFFVGLTLWTLLGRGGLSIHGAIEQVQFAGVPWYAYGLFALLIWAALTVATSKTRLGAAIAITATGFLVSLVFVIYRSPDIVLTQILIETVSTIFILLILYFMPKFKKERGADFRRFFCVLVSCAVGFTMFAFTLMATSEQFKPKNNLAGDYLNRTLPEGDGANAVNVIIVDFRAIDTTGELIVVVVVGMCIFGLLQARRMKPKEVDA